MKQGVFNRIYKLLACIAVSAIIMQAVYLLVGAALSSLTVLLWIPLLVLMAVGYFLQDIYGRITDPRHHGRKYYFDESGYESPDEGTFKPLKAALPMIFAAALAVAVYYIMFLLMARINAPNGVFRDDPNSLYPLIFALSSFFGMTSGIFLWFYPPHRVISLPTMFSFFALSFIFYVVATMMGIPTGTMTLFLAVFAICALVVLNQTHIQRRATDALATISTVGRAYNFSIIMVMLIVIVAASLVVASVLVGLRFIGRLLLALILSSSMDHDSEEYYETYGEGGRGLLILEGQPLGEKLLLALFVGLFLVVVVFFIMRGSEYTKRIIGKIKEWIREIFMFLTMAWDLNSGFHEYYNDFANFKDETIRLQKATIREYERRAQRTRTYKEFLAQLASLPTKEAQLQFAYVTLRGIYRSRGLSVKNSDTPRETCALVQSRTTDSEITDITHALEEVDFRESDIGADESKRVLDEMCRIIGAHLE